MSVLRAFAAIALSVLVASAVAPPATAGSPLGPDTKAVKFRETFGLRTDANYLASLQADSGMSTEFGVPLTLAEGRDLENRIAMQDRIGALADRIDELADRYGGIYIDQEAGGVIRILRVGKLGDDASLLALAPTGSSVSVVAATYSLAELRSVLAKVDASARDLDAAGVDIVSTGIDVRANRVRVVMVEPSSADSESIRSAFGPSVDIAAGVHPQLAAACASRTNCGPPTVPIRGGLAITGGGVGCTSGYVAKAAGGSQKYLVTAGHCTSKSGIGVNWSHNNVVLGKSDSTGYWDGTRADAGTIKLTADPATDNLLYAKDLSDQRKMAARYSNSQMPVGALMCRVGKNSAYDCGSVSMTNQSIHPLPDLFLLQNQWAVNFPSVLGDSGGTVFAGSTYGGVFSSTDTTTSWYSTMSAITDDLGVVPCLVATC